MRSHWLRITLLAGHSLGPFFDNFVLLPSIIFFFDSSLLKHSLVDCGMSLIIIIPTEHASAAFCTTAHFTVVIVRRSATVLILATIMAPGVSLSLRLPMVSAVTIFTIPLIPFIIAF